MASIRQSVTALLQLGPQPLALYAVYRLYLYLGLARRPAIDWRLTEEALPSLVSNLKKLMPIPGQDELQARFTSPALPNIDSQVEDILNRKIRLFGLQQPQAEAVDLVLNPGSPLASWVDYEIGKEPMPDEDPKFTWEPGRFGWAYLLGRSYHLTGDERCPQAFWQFTENFLDANPPYLGPHWVSAQEVALRLMAFCWGQRAFGESPHSSQPRQTRLFESIVAHAARIPPTLVYARSQNNNHLLVEAAGLYTAGSLMGSVHPQAAKWRRLGWKWFHRGIRDQVSLDGSYCQHSTNYHRVMLQAALWMHALANRRGDAFPKESQTRLRAATRWLRDLLDPVSGNVPNLGPNDGAYIFPLTSLPFSDFRPVVEAASRAFVKKDDVANRESPHPAPMKLAPPLPLGEGVSLHDPDSVPIDASRPAPEGEGGLLYDPGSMPADAARPAPEGEGGLLYNPGSIPSDAARPAPEGEEIEEMSLWYGLSIIPPSPVPRLPSSVTRPRSSVSGFPSSVLRPPSLKSWSYLRLARFTSRPGHADQLHLDLWWRGINIAQDAGTYRYTAPAPWDNALTHAAVHNTITVDGLDQMRRAGRFLYLDWAQAQILSRDKAEDGSWERLVASHNGYRRLGITHQRVVTASHTPMTASHTPMTASYTPMTAFTGDRWLVNDLLEKTGGGKVTKHTFRLHWLLPDWEWRIEANTIHLQSPFGVVSLEINAFHGEDPASSQLILVRAGKRIYGAVDPPYIEILGWVSPTYSVKDPALSLVAEMVSGLPARFTSDWSFP